MDTNINFPHLHIFLDKVGKSISIGDFTIAYYGIIIAIGMLAGLGIACWKAKQTGQNPETYVDLAIIAIICSLIGARIYYVIFQWDYYKNNPSSIINIREGGLAIYGGVIAAIITVFVFSKIKKIPYGRLCDTAGLGLVLGQIIGRWGNFFNREAFGGYTDSLFAMQLPVSAVRTGDMTLEQLEHTVVVDGITYIQVHPTFLYESAWNILVLACMLIFFKKRKFEGEVFLWYLGGYGFGRFWIEQLRTDSLMIPNTSIRVSSALGAVLFVVALVWVIVGRIRVAKKQNTKNNNSTNE